MFLRHTTSAALGLALILGMGCDSKKGGFTVGQKGVEGCELSLDTLDGSEWLYLNATPAGKSPDPVLGRMKFHTEDSKLKAKYNVRSKSGMYDYNCVKSDSGKELRCREKALPQDWCRALLAGGGTCDVPTLTSIDKDLDRAAAATAVEAGTKEFNEAKQKLKGRDLQNFMLGNNNLGNKLQARMYVKVDKKNCRLRVTDNYMTIYNGKSLEDSNPNGTNAFVKNEMGPLLWENCNKDQSKNLVARPEMGFPKKPAKVAHLARYKVGQQVQFTYLGFDGQKPKDGCTFSFDIWIDGKPAAQDLKPGTAKVKFKGRMTPVAAWLWDKKLDKPSPADGEYVAMVRYQTCGGTKEQVGVACAAVKAE